MISTTTALSAADYRFEIRGSAYTDGKCFFICFASVRRATRLLSNSLYPFPNSFVCSVNTKGVQGFYAIFTEHVRSIRRRYRYDRFRDTRRLWANSFVDNATIVCVVFVGDSFLLLFSLLVTSFVSTIVSKSRDDRISLDRVQQRASKKRKFTRSSAKPMVVLYTSLAPRAVERIMNIGSPSKNKMKNNAFPDNIFR